MIVGKMGLPSVAVARSGKQNIAEGCIASGTSKKTELKLVNVARASLEELLLDYQDFIRQRRHRLWDKQDREAVFVRKLSRKEERTYKTYRTYVETRSGEVVANIIICIIHQTNYLLSRQIASLAEAFEAEGGFTERLYRVRKQRRNGSPDTA